MPALRLSDMRYRLKTLMILTAVVPPLIWGLVWLPVLRGRNKNIHAARIQVQLLAEAVNLYTLEIGTLPSSWGDLLVPPVNLSAPQKWTGPYLQNPSPPRDPWGKVYGYLVLNRAKGEFQICSHGPDGVLGTQDDIATESPWFAARPTATRR